MQLLKEKELLFYQNILINCWFVFDWSEMNILGVVLVILIVPDQKVVVGAVLNPVVHGRCLYFQWVVSKTVSARFYRSSKNRVSFRQGVMNSIKF